MTSLSRMLMAGALSLTATTTVYGHAGHGHEGSVHLHFELIDTPLVPQALPSTAALGSSSALVPSPGFDIVLDFGGATLTAAESAAFASAEATWESIITGYQTSDIFDNKLEIDVTLEPIDGPFMIVGSAGPTSIKFDAAGTGINDDFLYAQTGVMTFDTADTARLAGEGLLDEVILHEMAHVIGIGTLWSASDAVGVTGRQEVYTDGTGEYTGAFGLAEYNRLFGLDEDFIPVELDGGPGTADGHWNEAIDNPFVEDVPGLDSQPGDDLIAPVVVDPNSPFFGLSLNDELLTGVISGEAFLSTFTQQSLRDIGFTVIPVPEPYGLALLGLGGGLLTLRRRRAAAA